MVGGCFGADLIIEVLVRDVVDVEGLLEVEVVLHVKVGVNTEVVC